MRRISIALALCTAVAGCACSRDESQSEPPQPPPPASPTTTPKPSAPSPTPETVDATSTIKWTAPDGWRSMPASGAMKAHFTPVEYEDEEGRKDRVHVYIIQNRGVQGETSEERFTDAKKRELEVFAKVAEKSEQTRTVNGTTVTLMELRGHMKMIRSKQLGDELEVEKRLGHTMITALVPANDFPYRVVVFGPTRLVDQLRPEFMQLVDSIELIEPDPAGN